MTDIKDLKKETWRYVPGHPISFCMKLGSIEIQTRQIPNENGVAFQGRKIEKNKYGQITKITPWETTTVLT